MPSDKSIQPSQDTRASDPDVEIITPLKVRGRSPQPDVSRLKRPFVATVLLLLVGLTAMAAGGFFFIRHISKHAAYMADGTDQTAQLKTDVQGKPAPDTTETNKQPAAPLTTPAPVPSERQLTAVPQQTIDPAKLVREKENAERLEAANRLIASGKRHEENNRPDFALADYREALEFDPESEIAQNALNRVKEQIADRQFQKLMSDGLTAYHNGNNQEARAKLLKAKSFRSDSHEVQEALVQVAEAIRLDTIETLRREAITAERAEDWEQALKSYLAVLNDDPNISFALLGKELSLEQIRIAKRMSFLLQKPETLESNQQLQNAVLLIEEAEKLKPKGPRLNTRLEELKSLVAVYRTPIKVTIASDNFTEVAVYKVGKLGRFTTRELSLRPGKYTVVGARNGFKDVRQNIIVKPGQKALRITVICTSKVEP